MAKKGMASFITTFGTTNGGDVELVSFDSGLRENMVPRDAEATLKTTNAEAISEQFETFVAANEIEGESELSADGINLHVVGKAAHGMEPRNGVNSGTYLATFLNQLGLQGGC